MMSGMMSVSVCANIQSLQPLPDAMREGVRAQKCIQAEIPMTVAKIPIKSRDSLYSVMSPPCSVHDASLIMYTLLLKCAFATEIHWQG
jgi:hypothetical protein